MSKTQNLSFCACAILHAMLHRASSSQYADIYEEFRTQLKNFTVKTADPSDCGREFVLKDKLTQWLLSASPINGKSHLEMLLPKDPNSPQPLVNKEKIESFDRLLTFSVLLDIGQTRYLDQFCTANIMDSQLPLDVVSLQRRLCEATVASDKAEALSRSFVARQWKFVAATFELDGTQQYGSDRILPITRKKTINTKGGTAYLWQLEVPEDFVGKKLRAVIPNSKYHQEDRIGNVSFRQFQLDTLSFAGSYISFLTHLSAIILH